MRLVFVLPGAVFSDGEKRRKARDGGYLPGVYITFLHSYVGNRTEG